MKIQTVRERLLASTMIAGVAVSAFAATPALAQSQPDDVAEIVITGSRIPQPNLVTTSPVTQVTGEDIDVAGVTRVEDLVTQLPQAFAAQNSTVSNGATGTATVSLRNLGTAFSGGENRTLVLVDGRRLGYGSPNDAASDLNQIPGQLVERVEVLTGGASAVYGSDALAGVVNFIMRRNFQGVQLDMQYGFYQHNNDYDGPGNLRNVIATRGTTNPSQFRLPADNVMDGYSRDVTLVIGTGSDDGRANITGYLSYRNNDYIIGGERDYSSCSLGGEAGGNFTCGGSSTTAPARFTDFATYNYTLDPITGNFIPYSTAAHAYNFGPLNYFQRPDERYSFGAFASYELNDHAELYADMMFTDYSSIAQIAPSGSFFNNSTINCDNPLMTNAQATAIGCSAADILAGNSTTLYIGRRNVEGGGRQDDLGYQSYRMVGGVRGPINDFWSYDVFAQYSQVELSRVYRNDFSVSRLARALDVIDVAGTPTCRSVVNGTDPNCVPYDVFSIGGVTQAQLDYLQIPLIQTGRTTQQIIQGAITGDLGGYGMQSPWASRGVQVALGAEYRRDTISSTTDAAFASGDGAGQGGPTIGLEGVNDNYDLFFEAQVPLAEGQAWADQLSVDLAFRYSDYELGGEANTYKFGADWAPVPSLRFRGSFQHAVRAPNIIELFQAQGFNLYDMDDDPCDLTDPNGDGTAPAANCQGLNPWQVTPGQAAGGFLTSPAGQYNWIQGGMPTLDPEQADTYTVGFVFTPDFIPGFNLSVDYYNIEVEDLISPRNPLFVTLACFYANNTSACGQISRNSANGSLWNGDGVVTDLNTNIGGLTTSGVDVNANYGFNLDSLGMEDFGRMSVNFAGTWLREHIQDSGLGLPAFDCAGYYGAVCGTPNPEWRHRMRVSWESPWAFEVSGTWRYIGAVEIAALAPLTGELTSGPRLDRDFDAENYFDLAGFWQVRDTTRLRFGVNNVLDNDPPLSYSVGTTGNNNTYPQTYDAMGRYFFFGLTQDF
ncbi:TonB-dependent receptor plug domain-containing protein [Brevundimonas aveniformis]|uniref:TonB-dependent receptor plug domain-containing protein n=1 Tax=Brevundimonas aveniformis TaxID=370977 RepID=UPI0003F8C6DF|nr:TonB-dependent receptor [Brevundimonas aveniformis]